MNKSTQNEIVLELGELKDHREKQQLTVQAVADGMKVSKDFVHNIESGNFEKLGAPTFVRGHITNYCKVLGVEPSSILSQIPGHMLQHQQLKTSDAMGSSPLSHVRRQSNHFGRYAIGTALLGMLCMSFYFVWDKWSLPGVNQDYQNIIISQQGATANDEKKITYSSLIPQVSGPNLNTDQPNINLSENEETNVGSSLSVDEDAVDNSDVDNDGSLDAESNQEQETDLSLAVIDEVFVATETDNAAAVYSIVMEFEEQAWVSIKTLDGELVVQDLLGPGLKEFQVTEPVHFRIGNAGKMQLMINDNSIELAPLIRRNIADFNWPLEPSS